MGLYTFNWKFPKEAAKLTPASFPITCAAIMVKASHWVGFTFPGMMDEPGSLEGMMLSPIPLLGLEDKRRISFAILFKETANCLSAP